MQNPYDIPEDPEAPIPQQDTIPLEGDALPSYQNVTAEPGSANGRFGRWRGWIEKRAGERYLDRHERVWFIPERVIDLTVHAEACPKLSVHPCRYQ